MRPILAMMLFGSLAACGGGSDATPDADEDGPYNCAADTRGETFKVDMHHAGDSSALDFKLTNAMPSPPARNVNSWTLELSSMSAGVVGSSVKGGQLKVTPYMPDHAHGPGTNPVVTDNNDGTYTLGNINLWMPGVWQVTVQAATASGNDSTVFVFCIPE